MIIKTEQKVMHTCSEILVFEYPSLNNISFALFNRRRVESQEYMNYEDDYEENLRPLLLLLELNSRCVCSYYSNNPIRIPGSKRGFILNLQFCLRFYKFQNKTESKVWKNKSSLSISIGTLQ